MTILDTIEKEYGVFDELHTHCTRENLDKFCTALYQGYCEIFSDQRYLTDVHWIGRHYLASKKISMSALFYCQGKDLIDRNMKNMAFYSCYYALFSGLSANLLMSPHIELSCAKSISHSALSKQVENLFVRKGIYENTCVDLLGDLRFTRELYSYHLPLAGTTIENNQRLNISSLFDRLSQILPPVLQVSSLLSYLSYYAWKKKGGGYKDEYDRYINSVSDFFNSIVDHRDTGSNRNHFDAGDYGCLGYYLTRIGEPMPIAWYIGTEMLEVLESQWYASDEIPAGFDIASVAHYLVRTINAG